MPKRVSTPTTNWLQMRTRLFRNTALVPGQSMTLDERATLVADLMVLVSELQAALPEVIGERLRPVWAVVGNLCPCSRDGTRDHQSYCIDGPGRLEFGYDSRPEPEK